MQPAHGQLQLLTFIKLLRSLANEWPVLSFRRPLPKWEFRDYLGWQEQGDGKLAYGVFVQNGRLKGEMKKALRQVGLGFRAAACGACPLLASAGVRATATARHGHSCSQSPLCTGHDAGAPLAAAPLRFDTRCRLVHLLYEIGARRCAGH